MLKFMKLRSEDFEDGNFIPKDCTCEGKNVSPHLAWSEVPEETESFALIMEDPDAPLITWTHWIVYNIQKEIRELKRGEVPERAKQAKNSFRVKEYRGPCPPFGVHRYLFKLYALDVDSVEIYNRKSFYREVNRHKIEECILTGRYGKKRAQIFK